MTDDISKAIEQDPILKRYVAAYKARIGCEPEVEIRGGWIRINKNPFRRADLKHMTARLLWLKEQEASHD